MFVLAAFHAKLYFKGSVILDGHVLARNLSAINRFPGQNRYLGHSMSKLSS